MPVLGQNSIAPELLQGEWYVYNKKSIDKKYNNESTHKTDQTKIDIKLHFIIATTVNFKENGKENIENYVLKNDQLSIGYRNFTVVKLSNNQLKFEEIGDILYFKKTESDGGY